MLKAEERAQNRVDYAPDPAPAPAPALAPAPTSADRKKRAGPAAGPHFRASAVLRRRTPWSTHEMELLEKGVEEYGQKWKNILCSRGGFHHDRTTLDLKDKWRNVCKARQASQAGSAS